MLFRDRLYLILAGIFIASLVSCNLIFLKFFEWASLGGESLVVSVGILPYPVTFLVTDILSELYGKKKADAVVISGFVASIFIVGVVIVANSIDAVNWSPVDNTTFDKVFGLQAAGVFASMTAYLSAQFIDIRIFHFWKRLTKNRHLWLRNNFSTIPSQAVDTATVVLILCMAGALDWSRFGMLFLSGFLFKVIVAALDTPLFYLSVAWLKPHFEEEALPDSVPATSNSDAL